VRLAQLEKEKAKSEKRILETMERAEAIQRYRKRNEDKRMFKAALTSARETEIAQSARLLTEQKAEARRLRDETRRAHEKAKREMMKRAKEEREANEKHLKERARAERLANASSKALVKHAHDERKAKKEATARRLETKTREDYERRLRDQHARQREKEDAIAKMAERELALIEELRAKREEQYAAEEALELEASASTSEAFSPGVSVCVVRSFTPGSTPKRAATPGAFSRRGGGGGGGGVNAVETSTPRGGRAINDVSVELQKEGPRGGGGDAFDLRGAFSRSFGAGDGDGKAAADATRVRSICASLGHDLDVVALSEAMRAMDPDDVGVVDYPAFARWWNADVETRGGGEDGARA
jgi:hypothetical protein